MRETWEETGLIVELTNILGVYGGKELIVDYVNGDRASYVGTIFRGRIVGGNCVRMEEILEVRYFSRAELAVCPMRAGSTSRWMPFTLSAHLRTFSVHLAALRTPADVLRRSSAHVVLLVELDQRHQDRQDQRPHQHSDKAENPQASQHADQDQHRMNV